MLLYNCELSSQGDECRLFSSVAASFQEFKFPAKESSVGGDGLAAAATAGHGPVRGDVLDHVGLLPERPGADLAHEGLLARVDLEVLLEVEPLAVDEEPAHGAALVVAPVVVHVLVEVFQGVQGHVALDAGDGPVVVLDLVLVLGDLGRRGRVVVGGGLPDLGRHYLFFGGGGGLPLFLLSLLL